MGPTCKYQIMLPAERLYKVSHASRRRREMWGVENSLCSLRSHSPSLMPPSLSPTLPPRSQACPTFQAHTTRTVRFVPCPHGANSQPRDAGEGTNATSACLNAALSWKRRTQQQTCIILPVSARHLCVVV